MSYCAPVISVVVTILLTIVLLRSKTANKIIDIPNDRSLHSAPVPRIGGVALIVGVLSGWSIMFGSLMWWMLLPLIALFAVSIIDDVRNLSVRWRLLVHLGAALIFVVVSGLMAQNFILGLAMMFLVVWMTNLYNFMDGSDGLAGGMTLIGFSIYGVAALLGHNEPFAMLNLSVAAAAAGFLVFNFHPAKIFMGDAGSIPLGFLAAAMGLWGWQIQLWPAWFPLLVFSPFILDATVTLLKRMFRGDKVWKPHREHYYQRLLMLGVGHRNTSLIEYSLMLGAGLSALWALHQPTSIGIVIAIWSIVYISAMLSVDALWRRRLND